MQKPTIEQLEEAYNQPSVEPEIDFKVSALGFEVKSKGINSDRLYDLANLAGHQYQQQSEAQQYLLALKKQKEFQLHCIALSFLSVVAFLGWIAVWRGLSTAYHSLTYEPQPLPITGTVGNHLHTHASVQLRRHQSIQNRLRIKKSSSTSKKVKVNGIRKLNNPGQYEQRSNKK